MHGSIPELLSLRDEEPVNVRVAQHVEACTLCTRELRSLESMRERLRSLPSLEPPTQAWRQIQQELAEAPARRRPRRPAAIVAALVTATVALLILNRRGEDERIATQASATHEAAVMDALIAQSRELEQLLRALPDRPASERASTAATLDTLEERIQWLDFHISYAPPDGFDEAQARRLWQERVDLMDSLVKVRYAEAQRTSL